MVAPVAIIAKEAAKQVAKQAAKQAASKAKKAAKDKAGASFPGGITGAAVVAVVGIAFMGQLMITSMVTGLLGAFAGGGTTVAGSSLVNCGAGALAPAASSIEGIPALPLTIYQAAGTKYQVDWTIVAAIGFVESSHGTYGGATMAANGDVNPHIIGVQLNGTNGTGVVRDTDNGAWDRDTVYDRAVGPMQFIPQTFKHYAFDGNADGVLSPFNYYDAIFATANYLLALGVNKDPAKAVLGYNHSAAYVSQVLDLAAKYRDEASAEQTSDTVTPPPLGAAPPLTGLPFPVTPTRPAGGPLASAAPTASAAPPLAAVANAGFDPCGSSYPIPVSSGSSADNAWGGFQNGMIPLQYLTPIPWAPGQQLRSDAAAWLGKLNVAYNARFHQNICITDSYRSYADQVDVYARKPGLAATPGHSNHGWALATDLGCGIQTFGTAQYTWMKQNAPRYGFIHPSWAEPGGSKPEPWHWEFHNELVGAT